MSRSTCEAAFRRLDDFLDRRLSEAETRLVEDHLRICATCTQEFTFEASILQGIKRKLRHLSAPPDLLSQVMARLSRAGSSDPG